MNSIKKRLQHRCLIRVPEVPFRLFDKLKNEIQKYIPRFYFYLNMENEIQITDYHFRVKIDFYFEFLLLSFVFHFSKTWKTKYSFFHFHFSFSWKNWKASYFHKYGLHFIQTQVRAESPEIFRSTMVTRTPSTRCLGNSSCILIFILLAATFI